LLAISILIWCMLSHSGHFSDMVGCDELLVEWHTTECAFLLM
jgi:hypothetical protein